MNIDTTNLLNNRDERLQQALKTYEKTDRDLKDHVTIIEQWLKSQNHLPEFPHQNIITNFLLMNKFDIEHTKMKLEAYYSVRTIFPEFFINKHPNSQQMQDSVDKIYYIPLPTVTKEGYRVCVIKCVDSNAEHFKVYDFYANTYNVSEVRLMEDVAVGDILVYDFDNFKIGHFLKLTPVILRKTAIILEKVYSNRIKQIHLINTPKYASATISLVKHVMKPKMAKRIFVHKSGESILNFVPINILPQDYGGNEKSLAELNKLWKAKLTEYKDRFDALQNITDKEKLKLKHRTNNDVMEFHGNFKKLDFD